jgi:uncharacterized membrane protein YdjX (TVP38/TMEM64 family)
VALWALAVLALASLLATGLISMAGGAPALLGHIHQTLLMLQDRPVVVAVGFAVWALVANCLVLPAGSLSMIVGGAVLGPLVPAVTWTVAQLITAPLLYMLIQRGVSRITVPPHPMAARLIRQAQANGLQATALLRLMPIMPNAPATMLAATIGIDLRTFLIGSVLTGWVRPAYFSGLGALLGSLTRLDAVTELLSVATLLPLLALFAVTVIGVAVVWAVQKN